MENPTHHKLNEAKYFLDRVMSCHEQYRLDPTQERFNVLHYNLSAFLSAARSITFFMKKQYKHSPYANQFNKWYESKQKEMEEDPDLLCCKNSRNFYLHEKIPKTAKRESIYIGTYELKDELYILKETPSEYSSEFEGIVFLKNGKLVDELCSSIFEKLNVIVAECENRFLYMNNTCNKN